MSNALIAAAMRAVGAVFAESGLQYRGPDTVEAAFAAITVDAVVYPDRPEPELFAPADASESATTTATLKLTDGASSAAPVLAVNGYIRETATPQRTWTITGGPDLRPGYAIYRLRRSVTAVDDQDAGVDRGSSA